MAAVLSALSSLGSGPDLLRLLAVPVFGWAAWSDIQTRRVPNETWLPLLVLGVITLVWEGWLVWTGTTPMFVDQNRYLFRVLFSIGFLVPLSYGFWLLGGFGGADAKALITLAVLFPTYPTYFLPGAAFPQIVPTLGVFSMTVLSNTVVVGAVYPFALMGRNLLEGQIGKAMFVGRPIAWDEATAEYGRLLEDADGFTRSGMDLDALRMYLQWRGLSLEELRGDPDRYRDPSTLPSEPNPAGDGSIPAGDASTDDAPVRETTASPIRSLSGDIGRRRPLNHDVARVQDEGAADPWGAEVFLADIPGTAYGTTPEELRGGLDVLTSADRVWLTPGIPFIVPMFVGLVVSLVAGDLLFAILGTVGL